MLYFGYGEDFSSPAVLLPQLVDYQYDNPCNKPCQELNRNFNPVDWAFSFSSAFASRHLFSPPYIMYYIIGLTICQEVLRQYLVFYPQRYQHVVDNGNPRQAVTPGEGLSKEGKINGFGSIHCFQLIL